MPDLNESDLKTDFVELPTYASLKAVEIPIIKLPLPTMDALLLAQEDAVKNAREETPQERYHSLRQFSRSVHGDASSK
jgi:hypothetical protein